MTAKGKVIWSYARLENPSKAQRLPNGNTLIAYVEGGVLEVDRAGKTVWRYDKGGCYRDAERLVNGNTLIVDFLARRVIEVSPKGEIVWKHKHGFVKVMDADRLPNGNTLITACRSNKIIEVTIRGKVVWKLEGITRPQDADRLPNGHTLVAQRDEIVEYDASGKKVWSAKAGFAAEVNRH